MRSGIACGAAVVSALAMASCGGGGGDKAEDGPAGQPPAAGQSAQFQKLAKCLREHGATVPQPGQGGGPPSIDSKTRQAMQACRQYMPEGGGPPGGADGAPPGGFAPQGGAPDPNGG